MTPTYDLAHLLPHRPPFRLVDRVLDADLFAGRLRAERLVTVNDPLCAALSLPPRPGDPAGTAASGLPPTLVIEALAQAAACLNGLDGQAAAGHQAPGDRPRPHRGYLVAASDFEFPDHVRVGEVLVLEVTRATRLGAMHAFSATAHARAAGAERGAADRLIAAGRLLFAVSGA